ncbi:amphi-Trp domain-containing protein [Halobacteriales archaeon QH_6_64_20]|jgi:amphi-Trp domain-containing protein|nr:MAG: amphi-Trp domain-containing protein [Halobacteriales archaeon QH_6_64_20]
MADRTSYDEELSQEEVADRLREIAETIESDGPADIRVGNKAIRLSPSASIDFSIEAVEESRRFRSDRESVHLDMAWTPD